MRRRKKEWLAPAARRALAQTAADRAQVAARQIVVEALVERALTAPLPALPSDYVELEGDIRPYLLQPLIYANTQP